MGRTYGGEGLLDKAERYRRWGLRAWKWLLALVIVLHLFPVRTGTLRLALLVCAALLWGGGLALFWKTKWARAAFAVVGLAFGALFLGPGRPGDAAVLRAEYVRSLCKYEGVRYIWGGESCRGIDCSGLVRVGLIDADFNRGLLTLNPGLMREGLALWWFDCSADALKNAYRGDTRPLFSAPSLNALDYALLLPGDFAVSENGQHTLAYIGDKTWIEADPGPGRVIKVTVPSQDLYFTVPMQIMRWRQLP